MEEITILPEGQRFFIKKINAVSNGRRAMHRGDIVYARRVADNYKVTADPNINDFDRNLFGYQEHEMPSDCLDKKILLAIQEAVTRAESKTSLMIFSSQQKHERLLFRAKKSCEMTVIFECNLQRNLHVKLDVLSADPFFIMFADGLCCNLAVSEEDYARIKSLYEGTFVRYKTAIGQ